MKEYIAKRPNIFCPGVPVDIQITVLRPPTNARHQGVYWNARRVLTPSRTPRSAISGRRIPGFSIL